MTSAGRCSVSMTLAMVKVLPEPVTPSSTWLALAILGDAFDQLADRRRLVAGRLIIGDDPELLAALGLLRARGLVRHEGLAVSGSASEVRI